MINIIHEIEILELKLSRLKNSVKTRTSKIGIKKDYNDCSISLGRVLEELKKKYK